MFYRLAIAVLVTALLACLPARSQLMLMTGAGLGAAGCSQATNFINREDSTQTNNAAITTMICGMVADGTWSLLDALYILATNNTTNAVLNLVSSSFALTNHSATFTAGQGYIGDGSSKYLDTGFVPSTAAGNFAQNSGIIGAYVLNARTTAVQAVELGTNGRNIGQGTCTSNTTDLFPIYTGNITIYEVNANSATVTSPANTSGAWVVSRTASNAIAVYRNESLLGSNSNASTGLSNQSIFLLADNNCSGGNQSTQFYSPDQISAAFIGGGMTATQANNLAHRLNAYMTSLGINVY